MSFPGAKPSARQRSPNYPNVSLPEALRRVHLVFDEDRQAPLERSVVAKHMGYGGISGAADKTIGSIMQYGLLERVGKGEIRVAQLAVDIFHPLDEDQKRRAIYAAAYSPDVFVQLKERFGSGRVPSEEAAKSFLVRQEYLDRAIGPIISAYAETCQFLEQERATESAGPSPETSEESTQQPAPKHWSEEAQARPVSDIFRDFSKRLVGDAMTARVDQRVLTKGLLSKGATFEIIVSGQIGLKELNMLIRKLELDKEILAEGAEEGPDRE
jgi:hypothetical protein